MRKLKTVVALLISVILVLFSSACNGNSLETPSGLHMDSDYQLTWNSVAGARSYRIRIISQSGEYTENRTNPPYYSLASLAPGDYTVRVRAVGSGGDSAETSAWSEPYPFNKFEESGLIFEHFNNNSEYRVVQFGTASDVLEIPDLYRGYPVTEIADAAFRGTTVKSVTIGKNVRSIGEKAFYNCTLLERVVIPDSVAFIGESAFQGCSLLKEIGLPAELTEIEPRTFAYCRGLETVSFGENITAIGESAFYACSSLGSISLPDSVSEIGPYAFSTDVALVSVTFGSGLQLIDERAFSNCSLLSEVTFGALGGALTIGPYAFYSCLTLEEIALPEGLTTIDDYAFYAAEELGEVTVPQSVTAIGRFVFNGTQLYTDQTTGEEANGWVYAGDWLVAVSAEQLMTLETLDAATLGNTRGIAAGVFAQAPQLKEITLPVSLKYIGTEAFTSLPNLWRLIIPEGGVVSIGNGAFAYCRLLSNVQIGDGLEVIEPYAFYNCSSLNNNTQGSVFIPPTVRRIGIGAFIDSGLWRTCDEYGVIYAGNWAVGFNEDELKETVVLQEETEGIADYAFQGAETLVNLQNLDGVARVGEGAFSMCVNLSVVSLNRSFREIKAYTFFKCSSLYSIDLPATLETIGPYAFYICERLSGLNLATTMVKEVGSHAFYGCTNIATLDLRSRNENMVLRDYAFFGCTRLGTLSVSGSVKTVGNRAFGRCAALETVEIAEGVQKIEDLAFRNCESLRAVSLPGSVTKVGDYAFYACGKLSSLTMAEGLQQIGRYAFFGTALETVTLPASIVSIGDAAFKNCASLHAVTMLGTPDSIGRHAFYADTDPETISVAGLTFYLSGEVSADWNGSWNSTKRPVLQSCVFSEEGYLVSFEMTENALLNGRVWGGLTAPLRSGYTFGGWATEPAGDAVFGLNDLADIPVGTTLYAVWVSMGTSASELAK